MFTISSRQNALVVRCRAIARGEDSARILLDGAHLVSEALASGLAIQQAIVSTAHAGDAEIAAIVHELERRQVEMVAARPPVMAAVSLLRSPSAVVAVAARPVASTDGRPSRQALLVLACDVQDPGNIGAIVRVAEAAGATGMVAAGQSADPFGSKALRGSMGSALRLPIAMRSTIDESVADARRQGCRIAAAVPRGGTLLYDADLRGPLAVLVGSEGSGLADAVIREADLQLTIPMQPPVESLNAAVTVAIILYEARRQNQK